MKLRHCLAAVACGLAFLLLGIAPATSQTKQPIRVGMVKTLFTDIPTPIVQLITAPFGSLVKEFTGLDGQMVIGGNALELAKDLQEAKVNLAVFHGIEFGWAQQKYPNLRPLMIAINEHQLLQAHLLIRKESTAKSFADLKGKELAIPLRTKDHCRLFLEKNAVQEARCCCRDFFGKTVTPLNVETAIDDLCLGKFDCTVVDTVSMDFYSDLKPGWFSRLRVVAASEMFPPAVVAYRQGSIDEASLKQFQDGMQAANKSRRGREMMGMFKISAFEPVPADYNQRVANILKVYPSPEALLPTTATGGQ